MTPFVSGLELNRAFYHEVVGPIVGSVPHAACLLGPGSDVMGFDTEMSMDHDWGPRGQILVAEGDREFVLTKLNAELPSHFREHPVFFSVNEDGTTHMDEAGSRHRVEVASLAGFLSRVLGVPVAREWTVADWLSVSQQRLLEATADNVFHDDIGLRSLQDRFRYFPDDVWLYVLASLWQRVGQEEHLAGRCGYVGDELGAQILAARLVRDAMRICFLLERKYIPYPKWFGSAFRRLSCGLAIAPLCEKVLVSIDWRSRDEALAQLFTTVARLQNSAGPCETLSGEAGPFFGRPFSVVHLHSPFATALRERIQDPELRKRPLTGSIDTISDNTDVLCATSDSPEREF